MPFAGELSCLGAALLWAVAVSIFRRPVLQYGARTVNLAKCALGALLQGLTLVALGQLDALRGVSTSALLYVAASGIVGLTIGDTALFGAVARLGVHRTLLLQTLSPVFAAWIAFVWQGELPSRWQLVGGAVILCGVALVVAPARRGPDRVSPEARGTSALRFAGVGLGVLAALGQAAGMVLAKVGMVEMPVLAASVVRLAAAAIGLFVVAVALRRLHRLRRLIAAPVFVRSLIPATLLGTYLALFLMMLGVALAPVAIAATLLSVSPIFGLLIDALVHKQPVSARGVVGTLLAVVGVAILSNG